MRDIKLVFLLFTLCLLAGIQAKFVFEELPSVKELLSRTGRDISGRTIEEIYDNVKYPDSRRLQDIEYSIKQALSSLSTGFEKEYYNERPIIGILSQPRTSHPGYSTYIMAAYVKFIEQEGARAVPLLANDTDDATREMMDKLNGVLLPGGDIVLQNTDGTLTDYSHKGKVILDYAKKLNDEGTYYPVWAICQGFEQLTVVEAPYNGVLVGSSAQNIPLNVSFITDPKESRMFEDMPDHLIEAMKNEAIAYHNNEFRVDPETYEKDENLKEYNVLALTYDRDGRPMVASIEHKDYPIYSHQWHPEKNEFVWLDTLPIPHTRNAVELVKYFSQFFVDECRKNRNQFDTYDEERHAMIENNKVVVEAGSLQDIYLF